MDFGWVIHCNKVFIVLSGSFTFRKENQNLFRVRNFFLMASRHLIILGPCIMLLTALV